eukprot:SAG22_NODE_3138_length_1908_cov_2.613046_4_plen_138_part_00
MHADGLLLGEFDRVLRPEARLGEASDSGRQRLRFRLGALYVLGPPLVWSAPGAPGFVTLTVVVNAANVVALPFLTLCIWLLTSTKAVIGEQYANRSVCPPPSPPPPPPAPPPPPGLSPPRATQRAARDALTCRLDKT